MTNGDVEMSRTTRSYNRNFYNRECKDVRVRQHRQYRREVNLALRVGREIPRWNNTQGWETH